MDTIKVYSGKLEKIIAALSEGKSEEEKAALVKGLYYDGGSARIWHADRALFASCGENKEWEQLDSENIGYARDIFVARRDGVTEDCPAGGVWATWYAESSESHEGMIEHTLVADSQEAINVFTPIHDDSMPEHTQDEDCEICLALDMGNGGEEIMINDEGENICQIYDLVAQYDFHSAVGNTPELAVFSEGDFEIDSDKIYIRARVKVMLETTEQEMVYRQNSCPA